MASDRKRKRIQLQNESIFQQEPSAFEQKLIHNIFVKTMDLNNKTFNVRKIPPGASFMEDATLSNVIYSHPEDRYINLYIFLNFQPFSNTSFIFIMATILAGMRTIQVNCKRFIMLYSE